jgi:uncharacterized protein (UPF0276 family)
MVSVGWTERPPRREVAIGATYEGRDPRLLAAILPLVDFIEITPETIAEVENGRVRLSDEIVCELQNVGNDVKIVGHGVTLSIGSHDGPSSTYFRLLDELLSRIDLAWHSEHLGYTRVDDEHLGIMLALPKTEAVLGMISERVADIQRRYALPFLLENIVHVLPDYPGDYTDAALTRSPTGRVAT